MKPMIKRQIGKKTKLALVLDSKIKKKEKKGWIVCSWGEYHVCFEVQIREDEMIESGDYEHILPPKSRKPDYAPMPKHTWTRCNPYN